MNSVETTNERSNALFLHPKGDCAASLAALGIDRNPAWLEAYVVSEDLRDHFPSHLSRQFGVVPLTFTQNLSLVVAAGHRLRAEEVKRIEAQLGLSIRPLLASSEAVARCIERSFPDEAGPEEPTLKIRT